MAAVWRVDAGQEMKTPFPLALDAFWLGETAALCLCWAILAKCTMRPVRPAARIKNSR